MSDELTAAAALLADNSTYHNDKEQMAYLGAIAYIGGAAVFSASCRSFELGRLGLVPLIVTAVAGFVYVWWQLRRRDDAASSAMRYYNILVAALPEGDQSRVSCARKPATRLPKGLMVLTMLVWALWAFYAALRMECV